MNNIENLEECLSLKQHNVIITQMSVRDFVRECSDKYGWNDGNNYPLNIIEVFSLISGKYNIPKREVYSVHNQFRYDLYENEVDNYPNNKYVALKWYVIGKQLTTLKKKGKKK